MRNNQIQIRVAKSCFAIALAILAMAQVPAYGFSLTHMVFNSVANQVVNYGMHKTRQGSDAKAVSVSADMSTTQGKQNTKCPDFQAYGFTVARDAKTDSRAFYTCRAGYAGMFDPAVNVPLWVAEHLTKDTVNQHKASRKGLDFSEDPQIPMKAQAERDDYRRSGFNLGHQAPSADFGYDQETMSQSFLLSNAVPQEPSMNSGIWANLEGAVREMADRRGELFVITGPVFKGTPLRIKNGRTVSSNDGVAIPSALYKVVIDRNKHEMTAFVIPNASGQGDDPARFQVSVRDVEKLTGLDFNPGMPRAEADRQEVGGGNWLIPKVRIRFNDK